MEKADWVEEVHALLQEETPEGRNGWYQARDRLGQTGGFIEDVAHAWELSEERDELSLETRHSLVIASINSLSANIPPNLIARLVEYELWTTAQGLAYALQNPDSNKRDQALMQLSSLICTKNPQDALELARQIQSEHEKARALADIAPKLPDPQEALEVARQIQDEFLRARALAEIAPKLPDPQEALDVALEVASQIHDEYERARTLAEIASKLSDPQEALNEALEVASQIQDEFLRARALADIAPRLAELPLSELYPLWQETLHILAQRTRKDLLSDLVALTPVIQALGGQETLKETAKTIQDVGRWWP